MLLIGLTGGIASGKTLVSDRFAARGVPVIDADRLARDVVRPGTAGLRSLAARFGASVLTASGELDRAALRRRVFASPEERAALDGILHPLIRQRSEQHIEQARRGGTVYAVHAVPLLVETDQVARFDRIVVVDVPESVQIDRLMARDGGDEQSARAILAAQATRAARLAIADDVIDNTGTVASTRARVDALHRDYLRRAAHARAADDGTGA